jgi:Predicted DNA-binding protein with PD1-like DNA-binding motif
MSISSAAITSGVGMLERVELGFFDAEKDDYDVATRVGVHDLDLITGNIVRREGVPVAHVHAIFNTKDFKTYGGHVLEAYCHVTMEVFLLSEKWHRHAGSSLQASAPNLLPNT